MNTPFVGLVGDIVEVHLHKHNVSVLDCYSVVFEWGEKHTFYDVQLDPVGSLSKTNAPQ
jgi:hypothetical protein